MVADFSAEHPASILDTNSPLNDSCTIEALRSSKMPVNRLPVKTALNIRRLLDLQYGCQELECRKDFFSSVVFWLAGWGLWHSAWFCLIKWRRENDVITTTNALLSVSVHISILFHFPVAVGGFVQRFAYLPFQSATFAGRILCRITRVGNSDSVSQLTHDILKTAAF